MPASGPQMLPTSNTSISSFAISPGICYINLLLTLTIDSTSAFNTLGVLNDNVLYKSTHAPTCNVYLYDVYLSDYKMCVDQTPLPSYMNRMLEILVEEEGDSAADGISGAVGPCMEYMLQHRVLDTMYTFARTDVRGFLHNVVFNTPPHVGEQSIV